MARLALGIVPVCVAPLCAEAQVMLTEMVEMPDGVHLATDVYLPDGIGSWPAVLARTPYDKGRSRYVTAAQEFRDRGYAFVIQDFRGFHASEGDWEYYQGEIADGQATLDWVVTQTWCDGHVGTWGASALGTAQYLMAPGANPALRCQWIEVASVSLYPKVYPGGAFRWEATRSWFDHIGYDHLFDLLLQHRLFDAWWEPLDTLARAPHVSTSGLHLGGWHDTNLRGTLEAFSTLQSGGGTGAAGHQKLIVGPWVHPMFTTEYSNEAGELTYPADARFTLQDLNDRWFAWFDRCLEGEPTDADYWPAAAVYLMGAVGEPGAPGNAWLAQDGWPPELTEHAWYLSETGDLSPQVPNAGSTELVIDPNDPVLTLGGANLNRWWDVGPWLIGAGPHDQTVVEARADVLTFTTAPLTEPVTVMGPITATIWILPDTTDLDLSVRLSDVYPDGRSMLVIDGIQRARKRYSPSQEYFLELGVPEPIDVDLWSTAQVFNRGHRIRVAVAGSNWPRFDVNPNHGGDLNGNDPPVVARPQILFGPDHPSRILLPAPLVPPCIFSDSFEDGDASAWFSQTDR
jgi:predicted acyl esterase